MGRIECCTCHSNISKHFQFIFVSRNIYSLYNRKHCDDNSIYCTYSYTHTFTHLWQYNTIHAMNSMYKCIHSHAQFESIVLHIFKAGSFCQKKNSILRFAKNVDCLQTMMFSWSAEIYWHNILVLVRQQHWSVTVFQADKYRFMRLFVSQLILHHFFDSIWINHFISLKLQNIRYNTHWKKNICETLIVKMT